MIYLCRVRDRVLDVALDAGYRVVLLADQNHATVMLAKRGAPAQAVLTMAYTDEERAIARHLMQARHQLALARGEVHRELLAAGCADHVGVGPNAP